MSWVCRALAVTRVVTGVLWLSPGGCASGSASREVRVPVSGAEGPAGEAGSKAPPSRVTPPRTITLSVQGPTASARDFTLALGELLSRIGIAVVLSDGEMPAGKEMRREGVTLASVSVAFSSAAAPTLVTVQDPSTGEVRIHRELANVHSTQIDIETAAHIVYTSVETLAKQRPGEQQVGPPLTGAPEATKPLAIAAVAGKPTDMVTPTSRAPTISARVENAPDGQPAFALEIAPFYALHPGAGNRAQLNGGAGLAIGGMARRWRLQPGAWFSAEYRLPFELSAVVGASRAQTTSLRLTPLINVATWSHVEVGVGLAAGLDIVSVESTIPPLNGQRVTETLLGGTMLVRARVASGTQCFLAGKYEYDLSQKSLQIGAPVQGPGPGMPPVTTMSAKLPARQASIIAGIVVTLGGR